MYASEGVESKSTMQFVVEEKLGDKEKYKIMKNAYWVPNSTNLLISLSPICIFVFTYILHN